MSRNYVGHVTEHIGCMCTHSQLLTSEKHVSQTRTGFLDEGSGVDFDVHCWQKICLQETQVAIVSIPVMHVPSR